MQGLWLALVPQYGTAGGDHKYLHHDLRAPSQRSWVLSINVQMGKVITGTDYHHDHHEDPRHEGRTAFSARAPLATVETA